MPSEQNIRIRTLSYSLQTPANATKNAPRNGENPLYSRFEEGYMWVVRAFVHSDQHKCSLKFGQMNHLRLLFTNRSFFVRQISDET